MKHLTQALLSLITLLHVGLKFRTDRQLCFDGACKNCGSFTYKNTYSADIVHTVENSKMI